MSLRVIDGGVDPEAPRPIVWNRAPLSGQHLALVIRGAEGTRDRIDLAWDDGRPFLIGIRSVAPGNRVAVEAWKLAAELEGAAIRDERAPGDPWNVEQGDAQLRHDLERVQRERESARDFQPMPAGSLFDEVHRNTRELFNEET